MFNVSLPSPLQVLKSELFDQKKIKVFVKRDDLIHPLVSGNKWRKLNLNLKEAFSLGHNCILTFGGAYSNHLLATAVSCHEFNFRSIGMVRGEEAENLSETLQDCIRYGMEIHFIDRTAYKAKNQKSFIDCLKKKWGDFYLIPEGGSNELGVKGCEEIMKEIETPYDYVCCSAGTGTTAAGILSSIDQGEMLVFPALKGDFLEKQILAFTPNQLKHSKLHLINDYHFGGYAKIKDELVSFTNLFFKEYGIGLDLIYTAKLFYGIMDLVKRDFFPKGSRIVVIHSGGIQGNRGMENRYGVKLFTN